MKKIFESVKKNTKILGVYKGFAKFVLSTIERASTSHLDMLSNWAYHRKNRIIFDYITYIDSLCNVIKPSEISNNDKVWIFWWQGLNDAPVVIKQCVESIKEHSLNHEVVIISKDNINEYLSLPHYIMDKVGSTISFTHLSDIVRINLLSIYGGGWIDAGLFLTGDLPDNIFDYDFFTIKNAHTSNRLISNFRWTNGFMFVKNNNILIRRIENILMKYWELNNYQLEYFLLDYIIDYLYKTYPKCKDIIDSVPITNNQTFINGLFDIWNDRYDNQLFEEIICKTWCHRLSYKYNYTSSSTSFYNVVVNQRYKI